MVSVFVFETLSFPIFKHVINEHEKGFIRFVFNHEEKIFQEECHTKKSNIFLNEL